MSQYTYLHWQLQAAYFSSFIAGHELLQRLTRLACCESSMQEAQPTCNGRTSHRHAAQNFQTSGLQHTLCSMRRAQTGSMWVQVHDVDSVGEQSSRNSSCCKQLTSLQFPFQRPEHGQVGCCHKHAADVQRCCGGDLHRCTVNFVTAT